jgi:hypothetical protein
MRALFFALASLFITSIAQADALPLEKGRYAGGQVIVFRLTAAQKKVIDHHRTCHLENFRTMNVYTPYVFTLTAGQSEVLKAKKGFTPKLLEVYETHRGLGNAGPYWNLALRFSEDEIEIPLNLLLREREAAAEHRMQGWKKSNPCFPGLKKQ